MLDKTKYKTITRTITGSNNIVYNNDVVLLCDTSSSSVQIDLNDIPNGNWNTTYKLYVRDLSNNASVNNITITAPIGHLIDNQQFVKLTTNGKGTVIRIGGDNDYVTNTSSSTAGGCSFTEVTILEITNLVNTNSIIECVFYKITNPSYDLVGALDYVIVQGTSSSSVSMDAKGMFYVPDFQNESGNSVGIWNTGLVGIIPNVSFCIFNNKHYLSLTGIVGTDPTLDTVNWQLLSFDTLNGYQKELDFIVYSLINNNDDKVISRTDRRGNYVEIGSTKASVTNFNNFQFGSDLVYENNICSGGFCSIKNIKGSFYGNKITSKSEITLNTYLGVFKNSTFKSNSSLTMPIDLTFKDVSNLNMDVVNLDVYNDTSSVTVFIDGKNISPGNSSLETILDMNDVTIFNGGILTIPIYVSLASKIRLLNSNKTITKIIGLPSNNLVIIENETPTESTTLTTNLVTPFVINNIASKYAIGNYTITGRLEGNDYFILKLRGNINVIQDINILI